MEKYICIRAVTGTERFGFKPIKLEEILTLERAIENGQFFYFVERPEKSGGRIAYNSQCFVPLDEYLDKFSIEELLKEEVVHA